jgi:signal transduction histidine kinase
MDKPLIVVVSRDMASIFGHLKRESAIDAALFSLLVAGAVLGLALYQRRRLSIQNLSHRLEMERQRAESELRAHAATLQTLAARMLQNREDEKRRIAFALHEGLAQTLGAVKMNVEAAARQVGGKASGSLLAVDAMVQAVQDAIAEVRGLALSMRPSSLDDLGLCATVQWFCREYVDQHPGVLVDTRISVDEERIPDPLRIVIYRVVEEVFQEFTTHSGLGRIQLALQKEEGRIALIMQFGSDTDGSIATGQVGALETAMEMAILSGGGFEVTHTPQGTRHLRASWLI